MKTNLDSQFKTVAALENNGVWFEIAKDVAFLVRRFGGYNSQKVKQAMAQKYKPIARQVELGTISTEQERKVLVEIFVESSLADWKGIEIDGEVTAFDKAKAIKLLMELPELFDTLIKYSQDMNSYKEAEVLGNS